jgi:TonB-dependent receptor
MRAERTEIEAEGPLTDPTRNFQRRPDGTILRGANGQPLPIVPATDALGVSRLTFLDRGARAEKEYLTWLPSLNASWSFAEQLIGRVALHRSIGRPNYNQYAGGLTLPDEGLPPSPANRITMTNAAVKPWTADNVKVSLEYYFPQVGLISAGAFRRRVRDFFGATVTPATPEFLALYDLDPQAYGAYDVATQFNLAGTVRMEGYDVSYKQALGFLPRWARGVQVFANGAIQRVTGEEADNFANFIPKTASWGVGWTRERGSVRVNWNYKSKHRRAAVTGVGIEPGTYAWGAKRLFVDVIAELKLTPNVALFGNVRNLRDTPEDFYREGPNTPAVAQFRQRDRYGALWICGVKGTF